jgi:hypothetical protein
LRRDPSGHEKESGENRIRHVPRLNYVVGAGDHPASLGPHVVRPQPAHIRMGEDRLLIVLAKHPGSTPVQTSTAAPF